MLFRIAPHFFLVLLLFVLPVLMYAHEGEVHTDTENSIEQLPIEETSATVEETNPTEKTASSSEPIVTEDAPAEIEETEPPSTTTEETTLLQKPDIEILSKTIASSSVNDTLPFKLISEKMFFAIHEAPTFTFVYEKKVDEESGLIEGVFTEIVDTVQEIYEGSFVETIVESVTHAVDVVVDFVVPPAEGHEGEGVHHIEEPDPEAQESVVQEEVTTAVKTDSAETVIDESPTIIASSTVATEIVDTVAPDLQSFALVDGIEITLDVYDNGEDSFTIELEPGVYTIGLHSLELHVFFQGQMYVGYYTFTIDGSIVHALSLTAETSALVIADTFGFQTLWLQTKTASSSVSWEKIADETIMAQYPMLTFEKGVLFWTTKEKDALLGFDIVSNTTFSQTLNIKANEENSIEVDAGTYDVRSDDHVLEVEFISEPGI